MGKATMLIGECKIRIETDCVIIIGDGDIARYSSLDERRGSGQNVNLPVIGDSNGRHLRKKAK
jgi:hypothetical protein